MKKHLINPEGDFYKANLHCHSTLSDGGLTPLQLKTAYKANGYSILAITDHEVLFDHSNMNDKGFLLLTAYEMSINERAEYWPLAKVCHLNLYSRNPHNTTQVFFDPEMLVFNNAHYKDRVVYAGSTVHRDYSPEHINAAIRAARENGFIVSYNHPTWSLETYEQYGRYEGMFAVEVYNTCCAVPAAMDEHNGRVYDELLRSGKHVYCIATDDCHSEMPMKTPRSDSFGGWVMVKAPCLAYEQVFQALENGQFYASCGPVIKALYIEDGCAVLECEPAASIRFGTCGRTARWFKDENGSSVTEARVKLDPRDVYFRFEMTDAAGRKAYTNAYFMDELL